eukprot:gene12067-13311_t
MAPISLKKGLVDKISEDLITAITGFEQGTDNFKLSLEFAVSNFRFNKFLDVNSFDVKRQLDGLSRKFSVHCQYDKAWHLNDLKEKFLSSPFSATHHTDNTEEHHGILSLLLNLSEAPTYKDYDPPSKKNVASHDDINWTEYLLDGEEKLELGVSISDEQQLALEESDDEELFSNLSTKEYSSTIEHYVPAVDLAIIPREQSVAEEHHQEDLYWLQENIISQYWQEQPRTLPHLESRTFQDGSDSVIATEGMLQTFANASTKYQANSKVTEMIITRETLWMLQGIKDTYIYLFIDKQYKVRPNITMGHTSQASLQNILEGFASIGTKMQILRQFVAEVCDVKTPNLRTLRAFGYAISRFLNKVKRELSGIEAEIVKKNKVYTCLALAEDLKEIAKNAKLVFELLNACVTNVKDVMSSKAEFMAHVVNKLYATVCHLDQHGYSCVGQLVVILPIFLETIRPFFYDLGEWMSYGKLPVLNSDEFFIEKNKEAAQHDSDTWYNTFHVRLADNDNKMCDFVPKFLIDDQKKILLAGKSRGLLEAAVQNSTENLHASFDEEFLAKFLDNLGLKSALKNNTSNNAAEEIESHGNKELLTFKGQYSVLLYDNFQCVFQVFCNQISSRYRNSGDSNADTANGSNCLSDTLQQNAAKISSDSASRLLVSQIFENTLRELIDARYEQASLSLINMLKSRFHLGYHMSVMKNFFFMEAGDVMSMFYSEVFTKIRNGGIWQSTSYLTSVLHEALFLRFPKLVKTLTAGVKQTDGNKNAKRSDDIKSIDTIILRYQLEWPLTIIFDRKVEDKYNAIFGFLLQAKRAVWSLEQLRISDLNDEDSTKPRSALKQELYILRVRLLHFVQSFHVYIMTRILHSSGLEFKERLSGAKDFDEVLSIHEDFLEKVYDRCLLSPKVGFAKEAITRTLSLCLHLQSQWDKGLARMSEDSIHSIQAEFDKCSHFIQSFLNSLIKRGSFPHLELLSLSLQS